MDAEQLIDVKIHNVFCSFLIHKTCCIATARNETDWNGLILDKSTLWNWLSHFAFDI